MSSTSVAPVPVGNCENSTAMSILQAINELREEKYFIDIQIEVREVLMHQLILSNVGFARKIIRGT